MVDSVAPRTVNVPATQFITNSKERVVTANTKHSDGNNNGDNNQTLTVYHQNIQGLKFKVNELMLSLFPEKPHLICLSEHHLKSNGINNNYIPDYNRGANYCRSSLKCGGVCIYVHGTIKFTNINSYKYCREQDLEIAAVKLEFFKRNLIVFCVYQAPAGDLDYFLKHVDIILLSIILKLILYCVVTGILIIQEPIAIRLELIIY